MLVNNNIHKFGLLPAHVYCIFARLTNSNVLGKLQYDSANQSQKALLKLLHFR
jgi:hypothetical protein